MNRPAIPVWLLPCIALTALLSSYSIFKRHQVEAKNKAVTLAVEYETVESLAAGQGKSIDQALVDLKAQGVGAVVLGEDSIGELIGEGYANLTGNELQLKQDHVLNSAKAIEAIVDRVKHGLRLRFPSAKIIASQEGADSVVRIEFASPSLIRQTTIGLNPSIAQVVKQAGLDIVCRMGNPQGVSGSYVVETLTWAHDLGATVFLPQGDQVLGRRDSLKTTEETLKKLGMFYATPEFSKIGGDENVVQAQPDNVVRLHSAQSAELDKLPLEEAIDRYAKAARERNMRVLLIRPVSFAAPRPLETFNQFVKAIGDKIRNEGGEIGPAHPFEDSNVPTVLILVIALSVIPTAYFVATSLFKQKWMIYGLVGIVTLLGLASSTHSGKPFAALMASMIFPLAAFLVLDARNGKNIIVEFLIVSAISLVGGLAIAGLLNSLPYFVRAEEFRGVKLAVFLPIAVIGWYFAARFVDLKAAMRNPVTWASAFLAIGVLIALAFMSTRTGNDNPAGVSDLELKFRNVLDAVLFVRPRTKSFLIGHPLLFVGIGLLLLQRKKNLTKLGPWAALALTGGAIGQTDIVNTMCHIHTPVMLSLIRNAVAIVPGCIIGGAAWFFVRRYAEKGEGEI